MLLGQGKGDLEFWPCSGRLGSCWVHSTASQAIVPSINETLCVPWGRTSRLQQQRSAKHSNTLLS